MGIVTSMYLNDFCKEMSMGWKTLTSATVFENPWIRVDDRQVLNPKGGSAGYGIVHFKHVAVGVVALDGMGQVYLVGQSRYALDAYSWEIPEGGVAADEDPLDGAKRELLEETGLSASNWQPLLTLHLSNSVTDEIAHIFVATGLVQGEASLEDSEDITCVAVPLAQAIERVMQGEITDAISVAALLAADRELKSGAI
jgi:8-oxo-dGTP pyrophosphatase MutT (NUDIX family)